MAIYLYQVIPESYERTKKERAERYEGLISAQKIHFFRSSSRKYHRQKVKNERGEKNRYPDYNAPGTGGVKLASFVVYTDKIRRHRNAVPGIFLPHPVFIKKMCSRRSQKKCDKKSRRGRNGDFYQGQKHRYIIS